MQKPAATATDVGLGVGMAAFVLAAAWFGLGPTGVPDARPVDLMAFGLAIVVAGALAVRRRYPFVSLVAVNAATLGWFLAAFPGRLISLVLLISVYTVTARRGWRWGLAAVAVTALTLVLIAVTTVVPVVGEPPPNPELVFTAYVAGLAMYYRRELTAAIRGRLAREAQAREEHARREAAEQRLRIAQEVHDIVGHAMATISVQAGVAIHVVDQRPGQAVEALAAIKKISDEGLANLKSLLATWHDDDAQPRNPTAGLDQLDPLLDATTAAGPRVELTVHGTRRPLPAVVDLAAYRIIQESLTNVLRHANADTVQLDLDYQPTHLAIRVRDDGRSEPVDRVGHGLTGMRQRVTALAGRFTAGPGPGGGFEVHCELPTVERA